MTFRLTTASALATMLLVAPTLAPAAIPAEDIATSKLVIKDDPNPSRRRVIILSTDANVGYSDAASPDEFGASIHMHSATDDFCLIMPPGEEWRDYGSAWKYRSSTGKNSLSIGNGKLVLKLKSDVEYSLIDDGSQGAVNIDIQVGALGTRLCMRCSAPRKDDEKVFTAKACSAVPCDPEPSRCGLTMLAFQTNQRFRGNLGGLLGADAKCQAAAEAAGHLGTFAAWLSDSSNHAVTRLFPSTIPYQMVEGSIIANDFADLVDGTIDTELIFNEYGGGESGERVWTGTGAFGTVCYQGSDGTCTRTTPGADTLLRTACNNWTSSNSDGAAVAGVATVDGRWTVHENEACNTERPLYCLEQPE